MFFKVPQSGAYECIMSDHGINAGTKLFCHGKTPFIHHIASEIRPSSADIRFGHMDGAPFARKKKNAVPVRAGADCNFCVLHIAVGRNKAFRVHMQMGAQARQIARANHDAAFALAACSAHPALKYFGRVAVLRCGQCFSHQATGPPYPRVGPACLLRPQWQWFLRNPARRVLCRQTYRNSILLIYKMQDIHRDAKKTLSRPLFSLKILRYQMLTDWFCIFWLIDEPCIKSVLFYDTKTKGVDYVYGRRTPA